MSNINNLIENLLNIIYSLPAYIIYSIIIFPLIVLLAYTVLYKYLNLERSALSFVCFLINMLIFISFSLGSFSLLFANNLAPIYLNDLSLLAKYRYLLICIAFFTVFFVFLLSYFVKPIKNSISFFLFPHLQEEIRKILYIKNETLWGPFFSYIIEGLEKSKLFMAVFYTIHFLVFILFRSYLVYLLINFTFFHGDFREIWYTIPFSFSIWLLQFLNYYFSSFLTGSYHAFHNLFVFKVIDGITVVAFSQEASKEGYPDRFLENFTQKYRSIERVYVYFQFYSFFCKILSVCIFSLQIFCWYKITLFFFSSENNICVEMGGWGLFGSCFRNLPPRFICLVII